MFNENQKNRLQELQARNVALSEAEQSEIETLYQIVETQEAAYLKPATERIREERRQVEENSAILSSLQH